LGQFELHRNLFVCDVVVFDYFLLWIVATDLVFDSEFSCCSFVIVFAVAVYIVVDDIVVVFC